MVQYTGPDWLRPYALAFWYPKDWLNGEWSENDQKAFDFLYDFNVFGYRPFGSQFDDILNQKNWEFYSKRNQISYTDIVDPRNYHNNFGSMKTAVSTLNFISSNVKRLYR